MLVIASGRRASRATHQVCLALTRALHLRGALRDGLDAATAADILYSLASPRVHQLLRRHRRWNARRYRSWLEDTIAHQLLG